MRLFVSLMLVLFLLLGFAATSAEAQCYSTNYNTSYNAGYSYTYYPASWHQGRYYPAGNYAFVNGSWYRQGYGYEYGYPAAPSYTAYYTQAAPPPCAYPPQAQAPPTDLNKLAVELLARHLVTSQTQQLTSQVGMQPAPAQQTFPGYYPQAAPVSALTPDEVAKLKALLAGSK